MIEIKGNKTTSFYTGKEDFIIDIIETTDIENCPIYETWLYREKTGHKTFVIGELKEYYPSGWTVKDYARTCIEYIRTSGALGLDHYQIYDQEIEDIEKATWQRIQASKL